MATDIGQSIAIGADPAFFIYIDPTE